MDFGRLAKNDLHLPSGKCASLLYSAREFFNLAKNSRAGHE